MHIPPSISLQKQILSQKKLLNKIWVFSFLINVYEECLIIIFENFGMFFSTCYQMA